MVFDQFRRQLEYKTQLYGSKLVVVDRFYPSSKTCSDCGEKKSQLPLSQRVFKCGKCGFECDTSHSIYMRYTMNQARCLCYKGFIINICTS
ncbi:transposase [Anabaena sp. FACHB-1237]|uniref:transposase n=1 Tax=Anabaena sp. FACHB-1237 TaxID=2692769 RepID=UPI001F558D17|nr:transposase [Anabaena sp. FACHB-1237]